MEEYYEKIPAKPTKYKGRIYRSRLEARVAVYFELCQVQYEYEPVDLKGWSPDFLVTTQNDKILFEVKPVWNLFDIPKILKAVDLNIFSIGLLDVSQLCKITKIGIVHHDFSKDEAWIESANEVMFLNPIKND